VARACRRVHPSAARIDPAGRRVQGAAGDTEPQEVHVAHKFEIYKDKAGEFRVRFKYNSETMFSTEGYASKASAKDAIDSLKKNAPDAPVEDNS